MTVRADFDRIARLAERGAAADDVGAYAEELLRAVPEPCAWALEVGCGTGAFTRRLARRARRVLALDLSPEMIRVARARSAELTNVEWRVADVMDAALPEGAFDCVVSIATLHHLPAAPALAVLRRALRPGGTLVLHDVLSRRGLAGLPRNLAGAFVAALGRARGRRGGRRVPRGDTALRREWRAAWDAHGRGERYLAMPEVRALCAAELPGADVREHLLWRYTVVWRRPTLPTPASAP